MDNSSKCPIGLLASTPVSDLPQFIRQAQEDQHDFVIVPIAHPRYRRVLFDGGEGKEKRQMEEWRSGMPFTRSDLILNSAEWTELVVGQTSEWIQLDSPVSRIRINSELALKQEAAWAAHLGLSAIVLPPHATIGPLTNYARTVNHVLSTLTYTQAWMRIPLHSTSQDSPNNDAENAPWESWNTVRTLCEHNTKLQIALEITADLPEDDKILDRWFAEPIRAVILPADIFLSNNKGFPVLSKRHQSFIKRLMKYKPSFVLTSTRLHLHAVGGAEAYQQYIRHLNRTLPELDQVERFASGYQDYLQAPLQPLADNLESSTYETFEKDPVKYAQYEKAVYQALTDRVPAESQDITVIMVVGAGRGPLVNCSLRAAGSAQRKVRVYAVEKNPNALVTLQNMKADQWGGQVTVVYSDMRKWKAPEKCDILVSELLGSFGDNELSPECLDGAQKFLKPDGISIPASYTAYIAPLSSSKLHTEVAAYKDLVHFETPYVVMFQSVAHLADSQEIWRFSHPNRVAVPSDPDESAAVLASNLHNSRRARRVFVSEHAMTMHGVAGYFEAELYGDIALSILPATHSPGMFSWFPIFFPLRAPLSVPAGAVVEVDFWRLTDGKKVWYEWCVGTTLQVEETEGINKTVRLAISPIHNVGGRSSWIGL